MACLSRRCHRSNHSVLKVLLLASDRVKDEIRTNAAEIIASIATPGYPASITVISLTSVAPSFLIFCVKLYSSRIASCFCTIVPVLLPSSSDALKPSSLLPFNNMPNGHLL